MPRANKKAEEKDKQNGSTKKPDAIWVNIWLDDEHTQDIIDLFENPQATLDDLTQYFVAGFDLSTSRRDKDGNFACYLSGKFLYDSDSVYKIASYAESPMQAIAVGFYKLSLFTNNPESYLKKKRPMAFG